MVSSCICCEPPYTVTMREKRYSWRWMATSSSCTPIARSGSVASTQSLTDRSASHSSSFVCVARTEGGAGRVAPDRGVAGGRRRRQIEQRLAERGVVACVGGPAPPHVLVQEAVAEPRERAPLVAQDVHGDGPTTTHLADDAVSGDVDVVKGDLGQLVGAVRLLDGPHLDSGAAQVDDEGGEPAMARLGRARPGEEQAPVGVPRPTRPDLATGDAIAVPVRHRGPSAGSRGRSRRPAPRSPAPRADGREPLGERAEGTGRSHRDERRGEDLQVLEERHTRQSVSCQASHIAARWRMLPAQPADLAGPTPTATSRRRRARPSARSSPRPVRGTRESAPAACAGCRGGDCSHDSNARAYSPRRALDRSARRRAETTPPSI